MAAHMHVKEIFICKEVWRTDGVPDTYIFEGKQRNSCLKKTAIQHYRFTPGFKQLSCEVKEAKIRSGELPAWSLAASSKEL